MGIHWDRYTILVGDTVTSIHNRDTMIEQYQCLDLYMALKWLERHGLRV